MNTIKKLLANPYSKVIAVAAIVLVILGSGTLAVRAYNGQLFGDCNNCTINLAEAASESLGAISDARPARLSTLQYLNVLFDTQIEGSLVAGGDITTVSTAVSTTLTTTQICDSSVISITPTGAAINVAIPATTTLATGCFSYDGAVKSFLYENGATAATSTTITAGTGITLLGNAVASTTASQAVVISQNQWARITLTRVREAEYTAEVISLGDAD